MVIPSEEIQKVLWSNRVSSSQRTAGMLIKMRQTRNRSVLSIKRTRFILYYISPYSNVNSKYRYKYRSKLINKFTRWLKLYFSVQIYKRRNNYGKYVG